MDDSEQEVLRTSLRSDPRFLAVTTLTAFLLAGSALLWRSKFHVVTGSNQQGDKSRGDPELVLTAAATPGEKRALKFRSNTSDLNAQPSLSAVDGSHDADSKALNSKSSRRKERRRRGKDPLKDIFKGGKKSKNTVNIDRTDVDDEGAAPSRDMESSQASHSRQRSTDGGESSRSTSMSSSRRAVAAADVSRPQEPVLDEDDMVSGFQDLNTHDLDVFSQGEGTMQDLDRGSEKSMKSVLTLSASHSCSSLSSDRSLMTTNTSPTMSPSKDSSVSTIVISPVLLPAPATTNEIKPRTLPSKSVTASNAGSAGDPPAPSELPPKKVSRLQAKSRTPSLPAPISEAAVMTHVPASTSASATALPPVPDSPLPSNFSSRFAPISAEIPEDGTFTFPTLNAASGSRPSSSSGPGNSNVDALPSPSVYGNGMSNAARRVPTTTPRRTPTPSSGTSTPPPPLSLSLQTQLASMRGGLEAARQREEKMKADVERFTKELDMVRWENAAWRRRELEMQTQIHHLMHQVQTYATLFSTMSSQPSTNQTHHPPNNGTPNPNTPNSTQNGYSMPNTPGTHSNPLHLQLFTSMQNSHLNGIISPPPMLSPMSTIAQPSPYFAYPSHLHQHPNLHSLPSPHQANIFSALFPQPAAMTSPGADASASSSVHPTTFGSSSMGSLSPDVNGSPGSIPVMVERGRRRTRTQTATVAGGKSGWSGEGANGWVEGEQGELNEDEQEADGEDEGDDFNEVLADAILKRPGSIRVRSKQGKVKERDVESADGEQTTEFTFPSLSELGNVNREKRVAEEASSPDGESDDFDKDSLAKFPETPKSPPPPILETSVDDEKTHS